MIIKDARILVTGAGHGIGKTLTLLLHEAGAVVGAMDKDGESLAELAAMGMVIPLEGDVSDIVSVSNVVEQFEKKAGRIDGLINNAGVVRNAPLIDLKSLSTSAESTPSDLSIWDQVINTNLTGVFYMTRAAVHTMLKSRIRGVIVNISSICAAGNAGQGAYSAAKAGVEALTVAWSKELGPLGIRVSGVAPGFAETETTLQSMTDTVIKDWKKATPLRRMAKPEEIADAVFFILKNNFMHGRTIAIDGGLRI